MADAEMLNVRLGKVADARAPLKTYYPANSGACALRPIPFNFRDDMLL
jgi:hypothetical protein